MPVTPTYPGVYIEEIPSGVHTITGVATSVAAFVGTFERGPLNAALHLLSLSDFQREYGGLDRNSETSYAVQQFFNNGGQECWVVRVADTADFTEPSSCGQFDPDGRARRRGNSAELLPSPSTAPPRSTPAPGVTICGSRSITPLPIPPAFST